LQGDVAMRQEKKKNTKFLTKICPGAPKKKGGASPLGKTHHPARDAATGEEEKRGKKKKKRGRREQAGEEEDKPQLCVFCCFFVSFAFRYPRVSKRLVWCKPLLPAISFSFGGPECVGSVYELIGDPVLVVAEGVINGGCR